MLELETFISFIVSHRDELLEQSLEHLMLTLISLSMAVIIGVSVGLSITKKPRYASPVLSIVNAVQTIPSIALLGFLLPFLGIGVVPAIVALFLYALLPIVRNTYTGIEEIDHAIKEAALGMGMNRRQLLLKVEIPLAMPVIFAGIRTAFVINVGVATLCALIAAGGLGEFIFRGLSTNNPHMILAGAIPAAMMALLFDWMMGRLQKHIRQMIKPVIIAAFGILAALLAYQWSGSWSDKLEAGFPSEFIERGDGYRGLAETYALDLKVNEMEIGLMYDAVKNESVDVISGFSTDGRIKAFDLISLEDDKNYFPPYHAAPLVRTAVLQQHPEIKNALNRLADQISSEEMAHMNNRVDQAHKDIEVVAREFLSGKDLSTGTERAGADIIIGSKNFTESYILAYIFEIVIENYTSLSAEVKLGFGGTKLLFDALNTGQVDVYPEYTGTGLLVILGEEPEDEIVYEKEEVYRYVKKAFREKYGLTWLEPLGFNNTFALMMRKKQAEQMGITKISDLSR
ncbi:MAG: ABC transporter permease/substrate-binding protein [Fulvivirga sp.]|nr:ABC transporter permease/substrate-binding protein [Fulvivirga sp.]